MTKLKTIVAAMMVAGVSIAASAAPPGAPPVYAPGPLSPAANEARMTVHERIAYALEEAALQVAEAKIHSTDCSATSQPMEVYSDTFQNNGFYLGYATVGTFPNSFRLDATALAPSSRGQKVTVTQSTPGFLAATPVGAFGATYTYNAANNLMVGQMSVQVLGANGQLDQYSGTKIKDFYMAYSTVDEPLLTPVLEDWGLQSLSKLEYPVEKYWQRSRSRRDDGVSGRTVFVKDRLVGNTPCRITVDLGGDDAGHQANNSGLYWMEGTLSFVPVAPGVPSVELTTGW